MRKFLAAVSLAALLALAVAVVGIGTSGSANAGGYTVLGVSVQHNDDGSITINTLVQNDETGEWGVHWLQIFDTATYDEGWVKVDSTPNPAGGSSTTITTQGMKDAIEQALQNGGGSVYNVRPDFYDTPFGKALVETGKTGSIIPYHNPADSLTQDFDGGYGGGHGGIDLNGGSIAEQIKQYGKKKKKDDDDDDGDGTGNPGTGDDDLQFGGASADMEVVNPVPEPIQHDKKRTALTRRSILDGGPNLLRAGPAPAGTALGGGAGSPLGLSLK